MKNSYILLFILLAQLSFSLHSQELDWFILNDGAGGINPQFMEVDEQGNSYIIGQFNGEVHFNEAGSDTVAFHTYTSIHSPKTFLLKYDAQGKLVYVVRMIGNSSNGRYADPRAFIRLSDGTLLLAAYTQSGIRIRDVSEEERTLRGSQQMMLIAISAEGLFLSARALKLRQLTHMVEDKAGKLFLIGTEKYSSTRHPVLFSLEAGETELKVWKFAKEEPVVDVAQFEGSIWFLTEEEIKSRSQSYKNTISLFQISTYEGKDSAFFRFSQYFEGYKEANAYFLSSPATLKIALQIDRNPAGRFMFGDYDGSDFFNSQGLFIFHHNGQLAYRIDLNHLPANSLQLQALPRGGYFGTALARKNFLPWGRTDSVRVPPQENFMAEKYLMKFDYNFHLTGITAIGNSQLTTQRCAPKCWHEDFFVASRLFNFATIGDKYRELRWRSGFFVTRVKGM